MAYLVCSSCGGERFAKYHRLRQMDGGNVVEQVAGQYCVACNSVVDTLELVRLEQFKKKKAEFDKLAKEIADAAQAKAGKAPEGKSGSNISSSAPGKDSVPDVQRPAGTA